MFNKRILLFYVCLATIAVFNVVYSYTHLIHLYDLSDQMCMNNGTDGNSIGRILVPVVSGGIFYTCGVARKWKWVPRSEKCWMSARHVSGCYLNMHNGIKGHYSFYVLFRDMKKQLPMDGPNDPLWSIYGNTCDPKSFLVCACESMIRYVSRLQDNKIKVESIKLVIKNVYGSFAANDTIIQGPIKKDDVHEKQVQNLMEELRIEISDRDSPDEARINNLAHQLRYKLQMRALEIRDMERLTAPVPGLP